ncbi:hypothetical protein [Elizabethkingia anophelis]|uniref:hypothetical protein n=1 Tax=Elizabethkingia anophelis TaxID=1117645 RepID=UPI000C6CA5ED|nr:hypothetical protein [Elizabethkingia anophelis]PKR32166.1 hypothetical protein CWH99_15850 [Elizabethkingia anophelis]PKR33252.1 hypothetical protein CWI00_18540 [Elizabethkingia anophelis]PRQ78792.1 hypothetical protein CMT60_15790 [Elizabethkingia anophelis]PRQ86591.1 hypothetical protein CMT87_01270 [Elizabethkingia anophelis]PRQ88096.1 hypothetical protein CMT86_06330 [Elizabethkingia anophelis]
MPDIALNTIFYILVFIIPGLIFRKFYFSGEFTKQFYQGHLLERFMFTILCSIICLLCIFYLVNFIRIWFNFLPSISYESATKIFKIVSSNSVPDKNMFEYTYKDALIMLTMHYFLSGILGAMFHYINLLLRLDFFSSALKYKNHWYYIFNGKSVKGVRGIGKKLIQTKIDALVNDGEKNIIYSGELSDYYIEPSNNKLDTILLKNAYKKVPNHIENCNYDVGTDVRYIPGNVICLQNDKIINLNITHFTIDRRFGFIKKIIWAITNIINVLMWPLMICFFWVDLKDLGIKNIESLYFLKKIIFVILILFNAYQIKRLIGIIMKIESSDIPVFKFIIIIFYINIPFIWVFGYLEWYWTLLAMLGATGILTWIFGDKTSE